MESPITAAMILNTKLDDLWAEEQVRQRQEDTQTSLGDTGRARRGGQQCLTIPSSRPASAQRHSKQHPQRLNLFLLLAEESSCQARFLNISIF